MEKYVYKGKNKEEILNLACKELGVYQENIIYKVNEEKGGLFQGKKISIEIVKLEDIAELGKNLIERLLNNLGLEGKIEKKVRDASVTYNICSNNNGILIGKRGKILESIQTFIKHSLTSQVGLNVRIIIDIENYKEKQAYFLERDVKKIAREVTLSKVPVKLDPMNSYERRIVHNALTKFDYIETISEGDEPNRCVVIKYKEKQN